jgi:hypothetical protein
METIERPTETYVLPAPPPAPSLLTKKRGWRLWSILLVVMVVVAGISALVVRGATAPTRLEKAFNEANLSSSWFTLADGGQTIIVDGPSIPDIEGALEFDQPLPSDQEIANATTFFNQLARLYKTADVPAYVQSEIGVTSALAGQQAATFDGLEARWSFHPDSGLDLTIHEVG